MHSSLLQTASTMSGRPRNRGANTRSALRTVIDGMGVDRRPRSEC